MTFHIPKPANLDRAPRLLRVASIPGEGRRPGGSAPNVTDDRGGEA